MQIVSEYAPSKSSSEGGRSTGVLTRYAVSLVIFVLRFTASLLIVNYTVKQGSANFLFGVLKLKPIFSTKTDILQKISNFQQTRLVFCGTTLIQWEIRGCLKTLLQPAGSSRFEIIQRLGNHFRPLFHCNIFVLRHLMIFVTCAKATVSVSHVELQ